MPSHIRTTADTRIHTDTWSHKKKRQGRFRVECIKQNKTKEEWNSENPKKICINRYAAQFKFEFHFECRSVGRLFSLFSLTSKSMSMASLCCTYLVHANAMNGKRNSHLIKKKTNADSRRRRRHCRVFCTFNCSYNQKWIPHKRINGYNRDIKYKRERERSLSPTDSSVLYFGSRVVTHHHHPPTRATSNAHTHTQTQTIRSTIIIIIMIRRRLYCSRCTRFTRNCTWNSSPSRLASFSFFFFFNIPKCSHAGI